MRGLPAPVPAVMDRYGVPMPMPSSTSTSAMAEAGTEPALPPGRGLLHLVFDAPTAASVAVGGGGGGGGNEATTGLLSGGGPLLTATNYDHAMAFPRTVDAPWGTDDADDAPPPRLSTKTPYDLDAQPELLNMDVPQSSAAKVHWRGWGMGRVGVRTEGWLAVRPLAHELI